MEDDDHIVQGLGVEVQSKIEDLEFELDESVKMEALELEIKLENDRSPECVKQETDMKIDIELEDLTLNYEDLKVKIETENVKGEEPIFADFEEEIDCYMIETKIGSDNVVSNEIPTVVMEYNLEYDRSNYGGDLQKHLLVPEDLSLMENEESLANQMQAHKGSSQVKILKCSQCSYQCKQNYLLLQHMLKHEDPLLVKKVFKCNECSFEAKSKSNLREHMLIHKDRSEVKMLVHEYTSERKFFRCDRCFYKTKYAYKFRKHLLLHEADRMFKCNECNYETKRKGNLKSHVRIHQPRNLKCSICSYQCEDPDHLKHSLHEAERMFKCNECNYETKWKGNLKTHLWKHQSVRPRNLKCSSCSCQFEDTAHLIEHMLEHKDPFRVKMF